MLEFDGQVVIVTGAASPKGIGRIIARTFAKQGGTVIVADMADPSETVKMIEDKGGKALGVPLNVTDQASVDAMVETVMKKYGRIDVLVNNAGISQKVTVADMTLADMKKIFDVNMFGLFLVTQACMKPMIQAGYGRIVNLSSVSAKRGGGIFGGAHYSAAKAAVLGFSKNLAREVSDKGITINSVCPGLINTEIWKGKDGAGLSQEQVEKIIADIPMKRPGEIQEVANAIVFLASKEASYITGEEIDINGGSHMD